MYIRKALKNAGVHGNLTAGIYGRQNEGASSVVLSGGYADEDHGERLWVPRSSCEAKYLQITTCSTYIGSGGRKTGVGIVKDLSPVDVLT